MASFIGLKVLGFGKLTNVVDIPYVSQASKRGSNKCGNCPFLVWFLRYLQK